jgi:hypothetical protein
LLKIYIIFVSSFRFQIIGAGLTAADAIVAAMSAGVQVIHVFRRDPLDKKVIFNNLPASLYPEYHRVHALMTGKRRTDPGYKALAKCKVLAIRPSGHVLLECESGCCGKVSAKMGDREASVLVHLTFPCFSFQLEKNLSHDEL